MTTQTLVDICFPVAVQSNQLSPSTLSRLQVAIPFLLHHLDQWRNAPLANRLADQIREIDFGHVQTINDDTVKCALQHFPSVAVLKLKSSPYVTCASMNITSLNLTELSLVECSPSKSVLVDLRNSFPNLRRLTLDISLHSVLDIPSSPFELLEALTLRLSAAAVSTTLPYVLSCSKLDTLDLTLANCSTPMNLDAFFLAAKCSNLRHLTLNSNVQLTLNAVTKLVSEVFPSLLTLVGCKIVTTRATELSPIVSVSMQHFSFSNVRHFLDALAFVFSSPEQQQMIISSAVEHFLMKNYNISSLRVNSLTTPLNPLLLERLTSLECPLLLFPATMIAPQLHTLTLTVGTDTKELVLSSLLQCFPKLHTLIVRGDLDTADFLGILSHQSQFRTLTCRTKKLKLPALGLRGFTQLKTFDIQGLHVTSPVNLNKLPVTLESLTITSQSNPNNCPLIFDVSSALTEFKTTLPISPALFRNLIINNRNLHILHVNNSLFRLHETILVWMLNFLSKLKHFQLTDAVECPSLTSQLRFLHRWPKLTFSLKEIDVSATPTIQDSDFQLLLASNKYSVQSVNISGCRLLTKKSLSDLVTLPILKEVKLNALSQLNDATLDFSKFLSLTKVELINCFNIKSTTVVTILSLQKLTSLNLGGSSNVGAFWKERGNTNLKELDISGWKTITEAEDLLEILSAFPNLIYLNVSNCTVVSTNKSEIIELLAGDSSLHVETEKDSTARYFKALEVSTSEVIISPATTGENILVNKSSPQKRKKNRSGESEEEEDVIAEKSESDIEEFNYDDGDFATEDIYNEDKLMKEAILRSSSEIKISDLEKEVTKMKEITNPEESKSKTKTLSSSNPSYGTQRDTEQRRVSEMSWSRVAMPIGNVGLHFGGRSTYPMHSSAFSLDEDTNDDNDNDDDDDDDDDVMEGVTHSPPTAFTNPSWQPPTSTNVSSSMSLLERLQQLEEEDIQRAIALSLQEQSAKLSEAKSHEHTNEHKKPQ